MNVLLDTHTLLWFLNGDQKLSTTARRFIEDVDSQIFVSTATIWEIVIKFSLGKLTLNQGLDRAIFAQLERFSFQELAISHDHLRLVAALPLHHRDPFDRLLIA